MIQLRDDYTTVVPRNEAGISLISYQQINDLQTNLCKMGNIYGFSFMRESGVFASYFGSDSQREAIKAIVTQDMINDLCAKFTEPCIETMLEYDGDISYIRMTAYAICDNDKSILGVCILLGFLDDAVGAEAIPDIITTTDSESYDKTIIFADYMLKHFYREKFYSMDLEEHLSHAKTVGKDLEKLLSKNAVLTNILKMLESENSFEEIAFDVFKETGEYLDVDDCMMLRANVDSTSVDCIAEWSAIEDMALGESVKKLQIDKLPFFNGKSYTISSDSIMPDQFSEFFVDIGISAGVFLPLKVNEKPGLYIAFVSLTPKKWAVEELKFLQDVKRVLQTVLLKRITKNSLASSYTALEAILENAGCGINVVELGSDKSLYSNDKFKNLLDDSEDMKEMIEVIRHTDMSVEHIRGYYMSNSDKWFDITFARTHWVDGREVRLATVFDVTDSKRYEQEIERRANIDYLTGLYNRKKCEDDLQQEVRRANVTSSVGALLYIDLDDFKNINDALGHRVGDHLLVEIAKALDQITGVDNVVYRIGGDEYGVLVPTTQYHNLEKICNRIVNLFSKSWEISEKEYYCTMAMGYVEFPTNGTDAQTLLQRADIALSYAKEKGKNRIEAFNEEKNADTVRRLDLEKALRDAVADDCKEFMVYYQPVVNVSDGGEPKCCGAEALIRWKSKGFGFMNPAEFIPLAEYLGLIIPIGEHILKEACLRCKYWNDFGHPNYKVNVNLSVVQLVQSDIVDTVARVVKTTGINPANLTLEVTESLAVNDMEAMNKVLNGFREIGCKVALDDFGTGYSSLNHIRSMPLDVIKIDKCFVDGVGDNAFSDAFVKTVSKLADAIDVNVCVEGVEQEKQKEALDEMNIQMIQGFLYDKPLPQEEFERKYVE